jgi:hypothetical protein
VIDDVLFDRARLNLGLVLGFADGESNIFGVNGCLLEEEIETVLCGISCIKSSNASSGIGFNASTDQFFGWEVGVIDVTSYQAAINGATLNCGGIAGSAGNDHIINVPS